MPPCKKTLSGSLINTNNCQAIKISHPTRSACWAGLFPPSVPRVGSTVIACWNNWCGVIDNVDSSLKENTLFFIIRARMYNEQRAKPSASGLSKRAVISILMQTKILPALVTLTGASFSSQLRIRRSWQTKLPSFSPLVQQSSQ